MESLSPSQVFLFNPAGVEGEEAQMTETFSPSATEEFYLNKALPEWLREAFSELKLSYTQISESESYHDYRLFANLRKVTTNKTDESSLIKQNFALSMENLQKAMVEVHLLSDLTSSLRNQTRYSLKTSFGLHHEINIPSIPIAQYVSVMSGLYNTAANRISSGKAELLSKLIRQRQFVTDLDILRKHWRISMIDNGGNSVLQTVNKLYSIDKDTLAIDCAWRNTFTQSTENSSFTTIVPLISHIDTGSVVFTPEFQLVHKKSLTLQLALQTMDGNESILAVHATSFDADSHTSDSSINRSDLERVLELCSSLRHQSKAVDCFQLLLKGLRLGRIFSYQSPTLPTQTSSDSSSSGLYPELLPCHVSETSIAWRIGSSLTLTADLVPVHSSHSKSSSEGDCNKIKEEKLKILGNTLTFLLQQLLQDEIERKAQETQLNPKLLTVGSAIQLAVSTPSSGMKVTIGITQVIRSGWHLLTVKMQLLQIVDELKACHLLQPDRDDENMIENKANETETFSLKLKLATLSPTVSTSPWCIYFKYHPTALCVIEAKISALQRSLVVIIRNVDELSKVVTEICMQRWLWLWIRLLQQSQNNIGSSVSQKQEDNSSSVAEGRGKYTLLLTKEAVEVEIKFTAAMVSSAGAQPQVAVCVQTAAQHALIQHVADAIGMQIMDTSGQSYQVLASTSGSGSREEGLTDHSSSNIFYLVQVQHKT